MLVEQAKSDTPSRHWHSMSAKGLLEAAEFVEGFSGKIAGTLGNLGKLLWPDLKIGG
jgi:hypothetical protein